MLCVIELLIIALFFLTVYRIRKALKEQSANLNLCNMIMNMVFFVFHFISLTVYIFFGIAMNNDAVMQDFDKD